MLMSLAVVEVNKTTIGAYPYAIGALVSLPIDGKRLLGERDQTKTEKVAAWRPVKKTKKMKVFFFFFFFFFFFLRIFKNFVFVFVFVFFVIFITIVLKISI